MEKIPSTKYGIVLILTLMIISLLLISSVSAVNFRQVYNPFTRQLDYYRTGNFSDENITVDNLDANNLSGNLTWTDLYGYPVACLPGYALTQLGDSIVCTAFILSTEEPDLNVNSTTWWAGLTGWVSGWFYNNNGELDLNESYLDELLLGETWFFTEETLVSGTALGTLSLTQQYDDYDGISYNLTEEVPAGLEYYVNTSANVSTDVNKICIRYIAIGDDFDVSVWDIPLNDWEGYMALTPNTDFSWKCVDIRDSVDHLVDNKILIKIVNAYQASTQHKLYIDAMYVSSGYTPRIGNEVDPKFGAWLLNPIFTNNINATNVNYTSTGNVNITKLYTDHIAEKTAGHRVVFDNDVNFGSKNIYTDGQFVTTGTTFDFKYFEGGIYKDFVYNLESGAFSQDAVSDVTHLGTSTNKWGDLWLSGDANIGGDALVTGWVNASNFNGTYYGDGSNLIGAGNSSWNQSFADSLYAKYNFLNNNFNGSGNFTTIGQGRFINGLFSVSKELLEDPKFTGSIGTTWDNDVGTWLITSGVLNKIGAPATASEHNPFAVKSGVDYICVVDVQTCVDPTVSIQLGGTTVTLFGETSATENTKFSNKIRTVNTNGFTITAGGAGTTCNISSISIREANANENRFGDTTIFNLNVQNKTIVKDFTSTGTVNINALFIDQGTISIGSILPVVTPVINITGQSATTGGSGNPIIFTAGSSSAGNKGGSIELTTGSEAGGTDYGDIILVKNGGKVLIGRTSSFGKNVSRLEVNGNVTVNGSVFTFSPTLSDYDYETEKRIDLLPSPLNILDNTGHLNYNYMFKDEWITAEQKDENDKVSYINMTDMFQVFLNNRILLAELKKENEMIKNCIATSVDFVGLKECIK